MIWTLSRTLVLATLLSAAGPAWAGPCGKLASGQKKLVGRLLKATYPYDCCDETLDRCLRQKKVCPLARRLEAQICRLVRAGRTEKAIKDALERRARSMAPMGKKARIDLGGCQAAGDPGAGVEIVAYACARCPLCGNVLPMLYRLVTGGPLKGKARLYLRPFPIRSHKGSALGGLAFVAAERQRKLWPFLLKLYANFDSFAPGKLAEWARETGMDQTRFAGALRDNENRKALVGSKKEGLRNGVKATPTLFINGRRYYGDLDRETLLDVLGEASDRQHGKR